MVANYVALIHSLKTMTTMTTKTIETRYLYASKLSEVHDPISASRFQSVMTADMCYHALLGIGFKCIDFFFFLVEVSFTSTVFV